jgi:hypothetical protein
VDKYNINLSIASIFVWTYYHTNDTAGFRAISRLSNIRILNRRTIFNDGWSRIYQGEIHEDLQIATWDLSHNFTSIIKALKNVL